ncbi:MAG: uridine diphosphate-N-acetylglucosamine-binding protein YvcK [Acidimicrobiales bacterium]
MSSTGGAVGPKVVALGGGHGLAATLQAVRGYAGHVTAVVSVADDGGSSGRLREALHVPPPGDLRRCLVALGDPDSVWAKAFEHRFGAGELNGHALGNLIIAGLVETAGDFLEALDEAGRLVGAVGRVLPATTTSVVLKAEAGGAAVEGQVAVATAGRITRVSLVPPDPEAPRAALEAIAAADQVVLGPGSLYTSVLAVTAVPGIASALADTPARKVYVCNLRPQEPETAGYDVAAHMKALLAHGVKVDTVLFDPAQMVIGALPLGLATCSRSLARPDGAGHDFCQLAEALSGLVG